MADMKSLPDTWASLPLGEVGRWLGGGTPSKAISRFWTGGNIPWVSPKDMKSPLITDTQDHITPDAVEQSATKLVEAGSILIVVRSGILQHTLPVAIAQRQVALNQDLKAVVPRKNIRPDFLAFALKAFEQDILHSCTKTGTTVQSVELPLLLRFEIPLAPYPEQKRIVDEIEKQFTRLEAGVSALRRVQANLKRYRASLLKAACEGRLVPTEARLARAEGRDYESAEQLLSLILNERRTQWPGRGKYKEPKALTVAPQSSLPEGWTYSTIDQIGEIQLGRQRSPRNVSKYFPTKYLRAANITEQGLDLSDLLEMEFSPNERERYVLREGDLILSEASGSPSQVGKPAMWRNELPMCCFQNTVIRVRPTIVDPKYTLTVFQNFYTNGLFAQIAGGVGINHLSARKFSTVIFPLPPLIEQKRIVAEAERRLSVLDQLEAFVTTNLKRCASLRQSILRLAFSGKLLPQDPDDKVESFPPQNEIDQSLPGKTKRSISMRTTTSKKIRDRYRPLLKTFKEFTRPITPEELFERAGFDGEIIEDVERFFSELRAMVDEGLLLEERTSSAKITLRLKP